MVFSTTPLSPFRTAQRGRAFALKRPLLAHKSLTSAHAVHLTQAVRVR